MVAEPDLFSVPRFQSADLNKVAGDLRQGNAGSKLGAPSTCCKYAKICFPRCDVPFMRSPYQNLVIPIGMLFSDATSVWVGCSRFYIICQGFE